jgi:DMSO/TMAO reductase YedYZ heme-binding membrane subunit
MNDLVWWYVARASGIVAWALLVASLVWGVLLATRVLRPHDRPAWLLDLHRGLGGLAMAMVGLHITALIADNFVQFGAVEVLVPLASHWRPLPVALGVLSLYVLVAIEVTSLAMRRLSRRAWRSVHLTSYGLVWLVSLHAGLAGTDTINVVYRGVAVALTAMAVAATCVSLLAPRRRRGRVPQSAVLTASGAPRRA